MERDYCTGDTVRILEGVIVEGYDLSGKTGQVISLDSYIIVELRVTDIRGNTAKKQFKLLAWEVEPIYIGW